MAETITLTREAFVDLIIAHANAERWVDWNDRDRTEWAREKFAELLAAQARGKEHG